MEENMENKGLEITEEPAGGPDESKDEGKTVSEPKDENEAMPSGQEGLPEKEGIPKKKKSNAFLYLVMAVCAIVLVVSLSIIGKKFIDYHVGEESANEARELVHITVVEEKETEDPYEICLNMLKSIELDEVCQINPDVIGWILIPDTEISYPIVQNEDGDYYLHHTWNRQASATGAIFMDENNQPDLSDFNTIIYGHRMMNGSMFAGLKYFRDQSYFEEHPYVGIVLLNGKDPDTSEVKGGATYSYYVMPIFSAYYADTSSNEAAAFTYLINAGDAEGEKASLERWAGNSDINTGVMPAEGSRVVTLSTCSGFGYSTRWVVQCCTQPADEDPATEK